MRARVGWKGKVVVITGASSGLGRAAAIRFAERGANVIVAARGQRGLQETVRMCEVRGGVAHPCVADVCVETDVGQVVRFAHERGRRIDAWVYNAGMTAFGPLDMESFATFPDSRFSVSRSTHSRRELRNA